jgi:hypothetical protein
MRHEFSDGEVTITVITHDTLEGCLAECVTSDPECTAETIRKHHRCWGFARTHEDEIHCWTGDSTFDELLFMLGHEYGHFVKDEAFWPDDDEERCNAHARVAVRAYKTADILWREEVVEPRRRALEEWNKKAFEEAETETAGPK